jgi:YHS domain-containing protein
MKLLTCIVFGFSLALLGSCGKDKAKVSADNCCPKKGSVACPSYEAAEVLVGAKTCCPVSKDNFTVATNSLFFSANGKKFYVCAEECRVALAKNPDQYLKAGACAEDGKTGACAEDGKAKGSSGKGHEGHNH